MKFDSRAEIVSIAAAITRDEIDLIQGCRELVKYFGDAELRDDPDALVIIGVESETDDLPVGPERAYWNPVAAAAKIEGKDAYITSVRPMVIAACRALMAKLDAGQAPEQTRAP